MTPEQQIKLKEAYGNGLDWPKMTNDPEVNCELDHLTNSENPCWAMLSDEMKRIYIEEARVFTEDKQS